MAFSLKSLYKIIENTDTFFIKGYITDKNAKGRANSIPGMLSLLLRYGENVEYIIWEGKFRTLVASVFFLNKFHTEGQ